MGALSDQLFPVDGRDRLVWLALDHQLFDQHVEDSRHVTVVHAERLGEIAVVVVEIRAVSNTRVVPAGPNVAKIAR